jgi:nitrite reductase/ring-hydroxylating ferredoxin subunit
MLNKSKPTLSDGTTIDELINLQTREVSMRLLSDHEIYKLEMERIFAKTWLLLGHETEVPNSGDYVVRDMGEDQVIVSRDRKGDVHVLLNVCPHRGMRVCMAEVGNAQVHRCVYHGWAFRPDGSFMGAPIEREQMHGNIFAKEDLGLTKARVQLYGGLIFATWNIEGPSLEDFLGDSKFYFDLLFCRTDGGLEVLGPPQKFIVPANWKAAARDHQGDAARIEAPYESRRPQAHGQSAAAGGRYVPERVGTLHLRAAHRRQVQRSSRTAYLRAARAGPCGVHQLDFRGKECEPGDEARHDGERGSAGGHLGHDRTG